MTRQPVLVTLDNRRADYFFGGINMNDQLSSKRASVLIAGVEMAEDTRQKFISPREFPERRIYCVRPGAYKVHTTIARY